MKVEREAEIHTFVLETMHRVDGLLGQVGGGELEYPRTAGTPGFIVKQLHK